MGVRRTRLILSTRQFSFRLRFKKGKLVTPPEGSDFLRALDLALHAGSYWHSEVLRGGEYPPTPTATPPRRCGYRGDRGRLYPMNYVSVRSGKSCCGDCLESARHADRVRFERECGLSDEQPTDGRPIEAQDADAEQELPPDPGSSPHAAAMQAMYDRGLILVECSLAPEDDGTLKRMVARHERAERRTMERLEAKRNEKRKTALPHQ